MQAIAVRDEGHLLACRQREAEVGLEPRADVVGVEAPAAREEARRDARDDKDVGQPHRYAHRLRAVDAVDLGDTDGVNVDGGDADGGDGCELLVLVRGAHRGPRRAVGHVVEVRDVGHDVLGAAAVDDPRPLEWALLLGPRDEAVVAELERVVGGATYTYKHDGGRGRVAPSQRRRKRRPSGSHWAG